MVQRLDILHALPEPKDLRVNHIRRKEIQQRAKHPLAHTQTTTKPHPLDKPAHLPPQRIKHLHHRRRVLTVTTEQYPLQHALRAHDLEEEHKNIVVGLDGLGAENVDDGEGNGVPDVETVEGADGAGDGALFFFAAAVGEAHEGGLDPGGGFGALDDVGEAGVDEVEVGPGLLCVHLVVLV